MKLKKNLVLPFLCLGIISCSQAQNKNSPNPQPTPATEVQSGEVTIKMTSDGFVPDHIKIKKGTKVIFSNTDAFYHWPASDLHPSHAVYSDFDPRKTIEPGQAWSFVFDKIGTWGMHDHISPYMIGEIIVVE